MTWTQAACAECYNRERPGKVPTRMKPEYRETERCCWCGEDTRSGIYVRVDPATVPYPGGS